MSDEVRHHSHELAATISELGYNLPIVKVPKALSNDIEVNYPNLSEGIRKHDLKSPHLRVHLVQSDESPRGLTLDVDREKQSAKASLSVNSAPTVEDLRDYNTSMWLATIAISETGVSEESQHNYIRKMERKKVAFMP